MEQSYNLLLIANDDQQIAKLQAWFNSDLRASYSVFKVQPRVNTPEPDQKTSWDAILLDCSPEFSQDLPAIGIVRTEYPAAVILAMVPAGDDEIGAAFITQGADDYIEREHLSQELLHKMIQKSILRKRRDTARWTTNGPAVTTGSGNGDFGVPDLIFRFSSTGTFLDFLAPAGSDPQYLAPNELIGKQVTEVFPPEMAAAIQQGINEALSTKKVQNFRYQVPGAKSGVLEDYEARLVITQDSEVTAIVRNITGRLQIEEVLKTSETRFRTVVDQSPYSIMIYTPDGKPIRTNQAAKAMWQVSDEGWEFFQANYVLFEDPILEAAGLLPILKQVLDGEYVRLPPIGYDVPSADGSEIVSHRQEQVWVQGVAYPVKNSSGQISEIVIVHEDVTQTRKMEQALLDSESRYRSIFEEAAVLIWEQDFSAVKNAVDQVLHSGDVDFPAYLDEYPNFIEDAFKQIIGLDINKSGLQLYQAKKKEELLGSIEKLWVPESAENFKEQLIAIAAGKPYFEGEIVNQTVTGEKIDIFIRYTIPKTTQDFKCIRVSILDISDRKRSERELKISLQAERDQRRLAETLSRVGLALNTKFALSELLEILCQESIELFHADSAFIWLVEGDELRGFAGYGEKTEEFLKSRIPLSDQNSLGPRVVQEGEPYYINHAKQSDKVNPELLKIFQAEAIMGTPLFQGEDAIGALMILDNHQPDRFSDDDIKTAHVLASNLAIAIENARLIAETQKRLREQTALRKAVLTIASTLEIEVVLSHIAEQMGITIDAAGAYLHSYDPNTKESTILARYVKEPTEISLADSGEKFELQEVFPNLVELLETRQSIIKHLDDAGLAEEEREHLLRYGAKSVLFIPLEIGGNVIAYAELWESESRRDFNEPEIALCQAIAQQAAIALANSRLYSQAQQEIQERMLAEEAEREQRALAEALRDTAATLNSRLETDQVLDKILQTVGKVVPFDTATIMFIQGDNLKVVRSIGYQGRKIEETVTSLSLEKDKYPAFREMLETRKPAIIADTKRDPGWIQFPENNQTLSYVGTPVILNDEIIGFLNLNSETPGYYSDEHGERLRVFSDQVAITLQNARLFEEIQQRAQETASLLNTTRAISSLDVNEILNHITQEAKELFEADGARIHLLEPDGETMWCVIALQKGAEEVMALPLKLGTGFAGHVAQTGIPEIINTTLQDERGVQVPGTPIEPEALVVAPIRFRNGEIAGVMTVSRLGEEKIFSERDLSLLVAFAEQASVALENARLFEATRRHINHLELLNEITQTTLTGSDLGDIFETLATLLTRLLNADRCYITIWDAEREMVIPRVSSDPTESYQNISIPSGEITLTNIVLNREHPVAVEDVFNSPYTSPEIAAKFPVKSLLGLPLISDGQKLGAALVGFLEPHTFSKEEIARGEQAAAQVSLALSKIQLLDNIQSRANELQALANVSSALSKALSQEEMFTVVLKQVKGLLNTENVGLSLISDDNDNIVELAFGVWSHRVGEVLDWNQGVSRHVIKSGKVFLSKDLKNDPVIVRPENLNGLISIACAPLIVFQEAIGTLWLGRTDEITQEEVSLLVAIADIAANALHRSKLREQLLENISSLEKSNDEIERLYRSSTSLISQSATDIQKQAETIVHTVLQEFGQSNCSLFMVSSNQKELERIAMVGPYAPEVSRGKLFLDGPGIVARAIRTGKIINSPDVLDSEGYVPNWEDARSELAIPLKIGNRVIGAIDVQSSDINAFSRDDERLMSIFVERAALTLETARLHEQTEQRLKRLDALRNIDLAISASIDLNVTLNVLLDQTTSQLRVDAASILMVNNFSQTLEFKMGRGFHSNAINQTSLRLGVGTAGRAALERRIIQVSNLDQSPMEFNRAKVLEGEGFVSYFGVPLIAKGLVRGVLEIFNRSPIEADPEWMEFLGTLAGQAAIAIDNANLFEDLQKTNTELILAYDETIESWARILDLRDNDTEGHSQRVMEMTLRLARRLGVHESELVHMRRGALLHDIGKMGIPDSILHKPSGLTEEEWETMHKHPTYAFDMLTPIKFLRPALDIPYYHHEKWDGSGYPQGIRGEQIPLAARVFSVVDVWDALCSDRPYRKAWNCKKDRFLYSGREGKTF